MSSIATAAAIAGSATISRYAQTRIVHTNSGMRPQPIPGARMLWIVATKLIAPISDEMPVRWTRKIHASTPPLGEYRSSDSGAYIVQPACGGSKKSEVERHAAEQGEQ